MDAYEVSIYHGVVIAGLFITGLLVFYLVSVIQHHRRHTELQRKYFLQEINILEKERTRIAGDLHDELAPLLSLAKFQVDNTPSSDPSSLAKASKHLTTLMLRLGEIAANLNANKLVGKGLCFALRNFLLEIESVSHLKVDFNFDVKHDVPPSMAIHLYRMTQEVLQNVIKHAMATQVRLQVKEKGGKLYVLVADNGKGFSYQDALKAGGIGLQSIRSRTGMMGGVYRCVSSPGKGTQYFFEFPFKPLTNDQSDPG